MTDSIRVSATLSAVAPVRMGYRSARPVLTVRCDLEDGSRQWNIVVVTGTPNENESIELRFDKTPSFDQATESSTDRGGQFLQATDAHPLDDIIRLLSSSKQLTVRFTPFVGHPVTFRYDLRGAAPAIAQVARTGCAASAP